MSGNQWCSGFLIAANTVVTSGHCVYNRTSRRFYDAAAMRVYPGYDSTRANPAPYGVCGARLLVTTNAFISAGSDEYDYGALKLTCTVGQTTGWFGWWYQTAGLNGTQSRNHGYAERPAARAVEDDGQDPRVRGPAALLRQRHLRRQQRLTDLHQAGLVRRRSAPAGA